MTLERLGVEDIGTRAARGHELRYRLAAGYMQPGDVVLDAASGIGYGAGEAPRGYGIQWIGVDREPGIIDPVFEPLGEWRTEDLDSWRPDFGFDVAVCFETLEHVADPGFLIDTLAAARRLVVCSVPIVPTRGTNEFHLHDFTIWDLPRAFADRGMEVAEYLLQPSELAAIYVLTR